MADGVKVEGENRLARRTYGFAKMIFGVLLWSLGDALDANEDVFLVDSLAEILGVMVAIHGSAEMMAGRRHTLMPQPVR